MKKLLIFLNFGLIIVIKKKMPKSCIRKKCPFMKEPFEECYCRHMSSQAAEKAIRFCGGNFEECDIYKQHLSYAEPLVEAGI